LARFDRKKLLVGRQPHFCPLMGKDDFGPAQLAAAALGKGADDFRNRILPRRHRNLFGDNDPSSRLDFGFEPSRKDLLGGDGEERQAQQPEERQFHQILLEPAGFRRDDQTVRSNEQLGLATEVPVTPADLSVETTPGCNYFLVSPCSLNGSSNINI
jgi:hypothetical protein